MEFKEMVKTNEWVIIQDEDDSLNIEMNYHYLKEVIDRFDSYIKKGQDTVVDFEQDDRMLVLGVTFEGNTFSINGEYHYADSIHVSNANDFKINNATKQDWEEIKIFLEGE